MSETHVVLPTLRNDCRFENLDGWLFVPKCHVSSCIVEKKKKKKMMPLNNVLHIVFGSGVQLIVLLLVRPARCEPVLFNVETSK